MLVAIRALSERTNESESDCSQNRLAASPVRYGVPTRGANSGCQLGVPSAQRGDDSCAEEVCLGPSSQWAGRLAGMPEFVPYENSESGPVAPRSRHENLQRQEKGGQRADKSASSSSRANSSRASSSRASSVQPASLRSASTRRRSRWSEVRVVESSPE
jgi:hypothetical protein